jgi:hypothetical protein
MSSYNFDSTAFRREIERTVNEGMRDLARNAQSEIDRVFYAHAGEPVSDILPVLRTALNRLDWTGGEDDYDSWAEAISAGQRIIVKPQHVRL